RCEACRPSVRPPSEHATSMDGALASVALFFAGAAGGALNSVAGGGSFIVFPTMLLAGIPPVTANATTTVALWPAGLASAGAYRPHLPKSRWTLGVLCAMSLLGGGFGAKLLLVTSDTTFARILPALMFAAAAIFTFGPRLTSRVRKTPISLDAGGFEMASGRHLLFGAALQLVISTYGGYFGGGMGIMMLATFTLMGMSHMHEMNALKVVLGILINGVALIAFIEAGKVVTSVAIPVALGSIAGGWLGAALARRVAPAKVRRIVLLVAWSLTLWFFYRALRK
ncbi:MAG TPA: sulfite exporter TauE/SafE family protein, partial [Labilithrix sp.]|nr:sulfite exporter TauE/SafE family protein [Labilithrix sp.]